MDHLPEELRRMLHDLKQPLNVIRLTCANLRHRLETGTVGCDPVQVSDKLGKIDEQAQRAAAMLEALAAAVAAGKAG